MPPIVISHAGCVGHAPENTLAGIRAALAFGADAVEVDVHASAEGVPVLMHDPTVDRTTSGTGPVASLTLAELRALDAGGEPVPALAEALGLTKGRTLLVAELKRPGMEEAVAVVVRDVGAARGVMVWSFLSEALEGMRRAAPALPRALLIGLGSGERRMEMMREAERLGVHGISVFFAMVDADTVLEARHHRLTLYAWTADDPGEIARLVGLGVDGIVTNYPERALAAMGRARSA